MSFFNDLTDYYVNCLKFLDVVISEEAVLKESNERICQATVESVRMQELEQLQTVREDLLERLRISSKTKYLEYLGV